MTINDLRIAVLLVCLLGIAEGCQGVPPAPRHAPGPYDAAAEDSDDGWLFDRLLNRQASRPSPQEASGVRHASAEEPVYPPQRAVGPVGENIAEAVEEVEAEQEESGFELSDLAPSALFGKAKEMAGYGPDEKLARQLYEEGQELYRQKEYAEAAAKFKSAAGRWPNSPLEEDAMFYRGESLFFANQYVAANDAFSELMKKYDNSRYLDRIVQRLFNIGRYWEQLHESKPLWTIVPNLTDSTRPRFDTEGHALKVYENIQLSDPTGPLSDDAVMAVGNAHFLREHYEEAAFQYDLLRKEYPKSEHQFSAHMLGMKSKLLMYQGPFYDGTSLEEAGEVADQTLRQFRGELGDERQRLLEEKNLIVEKQAEREWTMGQFYDKRGYYGAARFYYQGLAGNTRYARTGFAEMARKRYDEIKALPDKPPNRFKWLTDLVPTGH